VFFPPRIQKSHPLRLSRLDVYNSSSHSPKLVFYSRYIYIFFFFSSEHSSLVITANSLDVMLFSVRGLGILLFKYHRHLRISSQSILILPYTVLVFFYIHSFCYSFLFCLLYCSTANRSYRLCVLLCVADPEHV
jgi:hypothetical protein